MKTHLLPALALLLTASIGAHAATSRSLLGDLDTPADASRTVVIQPHTRTVNVTEGEVVRFVDQGRDFTVRFDGVRSAFNLQRLAPAGALDHRVMAYVAPDRDMGR